MVRCEEHHRHRDTQRGPPRTWKSQTEAIQGDVAQGRDERSTSSRRQQRRKHWSHSSDSKITSMFPRVLPSQVTAWLDVDRAIPTAKDTIRETVHSAANRAEICLIAGRLVVGRTREGQKPGAEPVGHQHLKSQSMRRKVRLGRQSTTAGMFPR